VVKAAGGLVLRDGQLLLVHRARYDDWSFPKGKLERGESWEDAALREVWEETGLRCELGAFVGASHYDVEAGPKEVRWWLMSSADEPHASNEVDAVRWVPLEEAREALSYDRERVLLDSSVLR
jgi:8-oxo-dGTP pyrophosphatase MutT (NUDIX family)